MKITLDSFEEALKFVEWFRRKAPPRPGRISLGPKTELDMARFGIKFTLPPPGASDVKDRELTITVNGASPPQVITLAGNALATDQLTFNQDDQLSLTLVDIDAAGNRSQPSAAFAYKVIDDVAPPQPGNLAVAEKVQLPDEPPPVNA